MPLLPSSAAEFIVAALVNRGLTVVKLVLYTQKMMKIIFKKKREKLYVATRHDHVSEKCQLS